MKPNAPFAGMPMTNPAGWLRLLAIGVISFLPLAIAFILIIDPYGVSPLGLSVPRINAIKLRRLDIDRALKPYEVWRDQPRTVFLGSSVSEYAIDPAVLDGTRFAPAYNAAIPNGSISSSVDYLETYIDLDPRLRIAIVEVTLSNFIYASDWAPSGNQTRWQFIRNSVALFASRYALWSAVVTLVHNVKGGRQLLEIKPGGYVFKPLGLGDAKLGFDGFPGYIWSGPNDAILNQGSLNLARRLVDTAREHGVELIFAAVPNHAYFDYFYDSIDAWRIIESALMRLAELGTVISFWQPNPMVYESVAPNMTYWNDPLHPSLRMGHAIQRALAGLSVDDLPANFAERLRPQDVPMHVESRRRAVREWAKANPEVVAEFDAARRQWLARKGSQPASLPSQ